MERHRQPHYRTCFGHTATLLPNGRVLVAGGAGSIGILTSVEVYDPVSGTWSATGSLTTARWALHGGVTAQRQMHCRPGQLTAPLLAARELDHPDQRQLELSPVASPPHALFTRQRCCPTVECWWQRDTATTFLPARELYDPASGTWSATGSSISARDRTTATLLPNGKVLVAGGENAQQLSYQRGTVRCWTRIYGADFGSRKSPRRLTPGPGSSLMLTGSRFDGSLGLRWEPPGLVSELSRSRTARSSKTVRSLFFRWIQ